MSVAIVATGKGHWDDHVKPMIDSILEQEPVSDIVIVDAGGDYPRTYKTATIIVAKGANCAVGQNIGMKSLKADWYLVCDIDVHCHGKFLHWFECLDSTAIWGNKFHQPENYGFNTDKRWIDGWIYAIPHKIVESIGYFDVHFKASGFEDADYCWRAMDAGFRIEFAGWPFHHKEAGAKNDMTEHYDEARRYNIDYLKAKHNV